MVILFSRHKYLLLTKFEVEFWVKRKKRGSVPYSTDRENELSKISVTSLGSNRGEDFNLNKLLDSGGQSVKYHPLK